MQQRRREETARVSNGIERSHYQDLLRETIYNELRLIVKGEPALISDIEEYQEIKSDIAKKYEKEHPGSFEKLKDNIKYIKNCEKLSDPSQEMKQNIEKYKKTINRIKEMSKTNIVPVKVLFDKDTNQTLILRLKNMGVNPAGNSKDKMWNPETKKWHPWSDLFDFSSKNKIWNDKVSETLREKRGDFRRDIKQIILSTLFQRLYFGFESAGLGFVCLNIENKEIEKRKKQIFGENKALSINSIKEISGSFIRLLGDTWRYETENIESFHSIEKLPKKINKYTEKCAKFHSLEKEKLNKLIWILVCKEGGHREGILEANKLFIKVSSFSDPVWICVNCQRSHLHRSGGICSNCFHELHNEPNSKCKRLYGKNYYSKSVRDNREPFRIHCEELSAQTDKEKQPERQRHFRGLILDDPRLCLPNQL